MNVIKMYVQVVLVFDGMLPKTILPYFHFVVSVYLPQQPSSLLFDFFDTGREIAIILLKF